MKVKELLKKLKNTDPEAEIYIKYPNFESDHNEYANIGQIKLDTNLDVIIYTDDCWKENKDSKKYDWDDTIWKGPKGWN